MASKPKSKPKSAKPKVKTKTKAKPARAKAQQVFGELTLIKRVRSPKGTPGNTWLAQCSCGITVKFREQYLFRSENPKRDCGHSRATIKSTYKREFGIWKMMTRRCYNPTHTSYEYYGGQGVTVHEPWRDYTAEDPDFDSTFAFALWLEYMGPAPSIQHTLDRINPFKGYHPGNVRWATPEQQANNTRWKYARRQRHQE